MVYLLKMVIFHGYVKKPDGNQQDMEIYFIRWRFQTLCHSSILFGLMISIEQVLLVVFEPLFVTEQFIRIDLILGTSTVCSK